MRPTRRVLLAGGVVVLLGGLVLLTPQPEGVEATVAVRRFLSGMEHQVADGKDPPPPGGTFVLPSDLRGPDEADALLRWVESGGKLVIADPASAVVARLGVRPGPPVAFVGTIEVAPQCLAPDVLGVEAVAIRASDSSLQADDDAFVSCFPVGDGAFLMTRAYGSGRVTLLGGISPLTNGLLNDADNAVLAAGLAAPGPVVVFGDPSPPAGQGAADVWNVLPDGARVGIVALMIATLAFAAGRAQRLGRPVLEEALAPIPASELLRATARMYRRARAVAHAGTLMRSAFAARFARGVSGVGDHELVGRVAHAAGVPDERVNEVLHGADPVTDDELIHLGRALEEVASLTRLERP
jgi:plasmid maintenance system antidote protein VapI